jgi:Zn-dependent M28 family amino/carboxypeptidase
MRFFIRSIFFIQFLLYFSIVKAQSSLTDSLFHPDSIRQIVQVLASDSLEGRFTGTAGNLKAAYFIGEEFKKAGLSPVAGNNGYFQEIKPSWFNVISAIKGRSKPGQIIIFSAHYDHIGTTETNPYPGLGGNAIAEKKDKVYNGANDNASGVAAVISLAKYFKQAENNERTLIFIGFTGEELGLLGSKYLANVFHPDSIVAVINIEMIGRTDQNKAKPFITGAEYSDLKNILNSNYEAYADKPEKEFFKKDPYQQSLFTRSDNYSFASKGVPAHSIMQTSPYDKYYHNLNDETETLDFILMKRIIYGIAIGTRGLVNGTDTPTRIKEFIK